MKRKANVLTNQCIACGSCEKVCPMNAISVYKGCYAIVNNDKCVGCGKCVRTCPASVIEIKEIDV